MTMLTRSFVTLAAVLFFSSPAIAGPPLICHPFEIEGGKLLAWGQGSGWNTPDRSYDITRLVADTSAILTLSASTSRSGPITPISSPAVLAVLPARALARPRPMRSIAPAVGMPSAMNPLRPKSCNVSNRPARTIFNTAVIFFPDPPHSDGELAAKRTEGSWAPLTPPSA